jgi:plastocyanin
MSAANGMPRPARRRWILCGRSRFAILTGTLAVVSTLSACFSERATGTGVDLAGCNVQLPSEAFGSAIIIIRNFAFTPAQLRIRPGTKVTWVNCGTPGAPAHTSTSDAGVWNSPLLAPGETFTRAFPAAGSFPFHCEPHPGMRGTVTVE